MGSKDIGTLLKFALKLLLSVIPFVLLIGLIAALVTNNIYLLINSFFDDKTTHYILVVTLLLGMSIHFLNKSRNKKNL